VMKLAAKYGAAGALIARATLAGDSLNVTMTEIRPLGDVFDVQINSTVSGADDKARADSFKAVAIDAMRPIEDHWKQRNTLRFGAGGKISALIPVNSLQEWLGIKSRLARVPVVEKVDLDAISKALVQVTVTYAGDETQLQFAMRQIDLDLSRDGDMWLLRAPSNGASSPGARPSASP